MRRRDLIALFGGGALWPVAARAQQPGRVYRIGVLGGAPPTLPSSVAFYAALARLGFVAGKNLQDDEHGYSLKPDQFPSHAAALAREGVDLIRCSGPDAFRAARQATKTIPLVGISDDMVGEGLVQSLAHPGGNITGVSLLASELDGKRLQLLLELLPDARRIGALAGADNAKPGNLDALGKQARGNGLELVLRTAQKPEDIVPALDALNEAGAAGVNVLASALLFFNRQAILERVAALRLPAMYQWPAMATDGGLIGYGPNLVQIYTDRVSRMAAAILRGTKPADIPVEQPTHFYLAVNLKTAEALGLGVPQAILARADEVIE